MSFLRTFSSNLIPASLKAGTLSRYSRRFLSVSAIQKAKSDPVWSHLDESTEKIKGDLYAAVKQSQDTGNESEVEKLWAERSRHAMKEYANVARINNNPYIGRSVTVVDGNIGDAFRRLDSVLTRNMVRRQLKLTERHEKKGPKRRRLESERWRRLFAHEVRKNVQLVTKIRKRGA